MLEQSRDEPGRDWPCSVRMRTTWIDVVPKMRATLVVVLLCGVSSARAEPAITLAERPVLTQVATEAASDASLQRTEPTNRLVLSVEFGPQYQLLIDSHFLGLGAAAFIGGRLQDWSLGVRTHLFVG